MNSKEKENNILSQVDIARKEIKTDHLQMSIGELINLYKDGDLVLSPAYQRLFRWDDEQKTRFIESIILGIPIPAIFVAQNEDAIWNVVDGLQRISTILQLTGDLESKNPLSLERYGLLELTTCKYIHDLKGMTWENLPKEVIRIIKRARVTINIILTENSIQSQYELFQRLNTGGIHLSDQEIRNCLIIMLNPEYHRMISEYKEMEPYKSLVRISDKKYTEDFSSELLIRYLIAKNGKSKYDDYTGDSHIRQFIDDETTKLISDKNFNLEKELKILTESLKFIKENLGENAFVKFNEDKKSFLGGFNVAMFESTLVGVANNIDYLSGTTKDDMTSYIKKICADDEFKRATKHGVRPLKRFQILNELSDNFFSGIANDKKC